MNKQTYITPEMEIMNIETVEMMAASIQMFDEGGVEESLSAGRRGSWGNLWSVED